MVFWYTCAVELQSYTVYLNSDARCVSKYPKFNIVILEMYCDTIQVYWYINIFLVQFVQFNSEGILLIGLSTLCF